MFHPPGFDCSCLTIQGRFSEGFMKYKQRQHDMNWVAPCLTTYIEARDEIFTTIELELSSTAMLKKLNWEICLITTKKLERNSKILKRSNYQTTCTTVSLNLEITLTKKAQAKPNWKCQFCVTSIAFYSVLCPSTDYDENTTISSNAFLFCKIDKKNSRGDGVAITLKLGIRHTLSLPVNITLIRKTRISLETTERNVHIILCYFAEELEWQFVDVAVAAEEDKMSNTSFADSTDDLHMRIAGIVVDVLHMETVVVLHFEQSRETLCLA
uniref:Uncharacterized protein n=1 Tax=Glossina austeni TaxID=7395 RepID=A0A1A9V1R9_GLOAU